MVTEMILAVKFKTPKENIMETNEVRFTTDQLNLIQELDAMPIRPPDFSLETFMATLDDAVKAVGDSKLKTDLAYVREYISDALAYLQAEEDKRGVL